jgi:hypothetical protein
MAKNKYGFWVYVIIILLGYVALKYGGFFSGAIVDVGSYEYPAGSGILWDYRVERSQLFSSATVSPSLWKADASSGRIDGGCCENGYANAWFTLKSVDMRNVVKLDAFFNLVGSVTKAQYGGQSAYHFIASLSDGNKSIKIFEFNPSSESPQTGSISFSMSTLHIQKISNTLYSTSIDSAFGGPTILGIKDVSALNPNLPWRLIVQQSPQTGGGDGGDSLGSTSWYDLKISYESQNSGCVPAWTCTGYGGCVDAVQTCTNYVDQNGCGGSYQGTPLVRSCQISTNTSPTYTTFNGDTTNFGGVPNKEAVQNAVLEKVGYGKIVFSDVINVSKINFDTSVSIGQGFVEVVEPKLNKPATVTLKGLSVASPKILRDGAVCNVCTVQSYVNGDLTFVVPGFSRYEVVDAQSSSSSSGGGGGGSSSVSQPLINYYVLQNNKCVLRSGVSVPSTAYLSLALCQEHVVTSESVGVSKTLIAAVIGIIFGVLLFMNSNFRKKVGF